MLPSQLLPYRSGVNVELERKADQIILMCAGDQQYPWKESNLLGPARLEVNAANRMMPYDPITWTGTVERTGIYIRAHNPVQFWLNSQPQCLGGRRDWIRREGSRPTMREDYERWGTMSNGRNDPWMAAMEFTTKNPRARAYQRRTRKLRDGAHIQAPVSSTAPR